MPKPPFFPQAYSFSCVPACLRMVLASLEFEKSEAEIRSFCDCDETGTSPSNAVETAIKFGFDAYQANLNLDELENLVAQNITPIIFTKVAGSVSYSHAVIVYKISRVKIYVIDPELGENNYDKNQFEQIWSRGLTIIIEKRKK